MIRDIVIAGFVLAVDIIIFPYACDIIDSLFAVQVTINGELTGTSLIFARVLPFAMIFAIGYGFIQKLIGNNQQVG